jgi:hypothetical protein
MKNQNNNFEKKQTDKDTEKHKKKMFKHNDRKKTTIPKDRKAPDTDEEGIGIVHKPQ